MKSEPTATNPPLRQACVVVLVGPPGSGKSEWAKRNGGGAVTVSQDDLIDAITPQGFDYAYRPVYGAAEEAVARAGLAAGLPVIVDRTNRTGELRARWTRIAREAGCVAVAVVMTAGTELCRARNDARRDHRRVSAERMERMIEAMQPPAREEGFAAIFRDDEATLRGILEFLRQSRWEDRHEDCDPTQPELAAGSGAPGSVPGHP